MTEIDPPNPTQKYWRHRGYLPHFDAPFYCQSVTFRLADSLPQTYLAQLNQNLANVSDPKEKHRQLTLLAKYLDQGYGSCCLRQDAIAELVEAALLHHDGNRYRLYAWCIMPNHVHLLLEMFKGYPLGKSIQSLKIYTAIRAHKLLQKEGAFWFADYFDHYIRNAKHFEATRYYIEQNPVKAGLVSKAEDWNWSSAAAKWA